MRRPSPAMVVAMTALFVAIGGTALALPGQNKVNSGDVKNETLLSEDLKDDQAVASDDIIDETLRSDDIGSGAVRADEIAGNSVGTSEITHVETEDLQTEAVKSAKIAPNAVGGGDLANITQVVDPTPFNFGDQDEGNGDYLYGSSTATCPSGSDVIGGGGRWATLAFGGVGEDELQAITESTRSGNGWIVWGVTDVDNDDLEAVAYCLGPGT